MKKVNYLIYLSLLTIAFFLGFKLANQRQIIQCSIAGFDVMMLIIPVMFGIFHFALVSKMKNEQQFVRRFMAMLTMKFLSMLTLLLVGLMLNRTNAKCYVVTFLVIYGAFLVFQTIVMLRELKASKK